MATLSAPAHRALALIDARDHVTFIELRAALADLIPLEGHKAIVHPDDPNMIMWLGMSAEFVAVLDELFAAQLVEWGPATQLTYLIDGGWLNLPLVGQRKPRAPYKKPHWLPVVLRPYARVHSAR